MNKAFAVVGANFGDEGKGLTTDYLCHRENATLVVRFNGGAQAGHTVVTPKLERHVFSHFGSGTFLGVPTYLSSFFVVNPAIFHREHIDLEMLGVGGKLCVYADLNCRVTTPIDALINQALEDSRGHRRHGSCGMGFNETIERCTHPIYDLRFRDLRNPDDILDRIRNDWLPSRLLELGLPDGAVNYTDEMHEHFLSDCDHFCNWVLAAELPDLDLRTVVFEGAQGLLLDQNRSEFFPHLTRSNTGIKNVRILCQEAEIDTLEGYYVSRTYLTRHGAGPFPTEVAGMTFDDGTNVYGHFQGPLRYGHIIPDQLHKRCFEDFGVGYRLVLTHCDQLLPPCDAVLYSYGPTRNDVTTEAEKKAA
jgi:adenylosuccinate synthase